MSLIEEALRRAQSAPSPSAKTPTPPPVSPTPSEPPPLSFSGLVGDARWRNAKWWVGLAIGGTAVVMLALWGYAILWRWQLSNIAGLPAERQPAVSRLTAPAESPRSAATRPVVAQVLANPTPVLSQPAVNTLPRRKRPPELALNGIVEGRGEPLAIINGMILRVGESVSGATLLNIRGDEATLRWRDEELVLSTTP